MRISIQSLLLLVANLLIFSAIRVCSTDGLVYAQPAPDLVVFSEKWQVRANKGDQVPLVFRTKNQGNADAGPFTDHLYVDEKLVKARALKGLKAGQENTKNDAIWTAECGVHSVKVKTDFFDNVKTEKREDNNTTVPHNIWISSGNCGSQIPIAARPSEEFQPDISGSRIVWLDKPDFNSSNTTIYLYDLATPKEQKIVTRPNIMDVKISGSRLLWAEKNGFYYDIFLYNLGPNSVLPQNPINPNGPVGSFDIDGSKIVWVDSHTGYPDIYLLDVSINNPTPEPMTYDSLGQNYESKEDVVISGDWIAWEQNFGDLYFLNREVKISRMIARNRRNIVLDISGTKIVWWKPFSSHYSEIYLYDIDTGIVPTKPIVVADRGRGLAISGDTIAWINYKRRIPTPTSNNTYNVYTYTISTGNTKQMTNDTISRNNLAIFGNRLVWEDSRNAQIGKTDIYSMFIPIAEP